VFFWCERQISHIERHFPDAILASGSLKRSLMTQRLKILNIVGARPNLPKLRRSCARLHALIPKSKPSSSTPDSTTTKSCPTFLRQMGIPSPHVNLEVGSAPTPRKRRDSEAHRAGSHRTQTRPVLVVGDVNSTIAVSLAAAKLASA